MRTHTHTHPHNLCFKQMLFQDHHPPTFIFIYTAPAEFKLCHFLLQSRFKRKTIFSLTFSEVQEKLLRRKWFIHIFTANTCPTQVKAFPQSAIHKNRNIFYFSAIIIIFFWSFYFNIEPDFSISKYTIVISKYYLFSYLAENGTKIYSNYYSLQ